MRWCRLYSEFATDPKVQQMPEEMQRRLVMLFCLHTSGDMPGASDEELMTAFRIKKSQFQKTFEIFSKKGFIDDNWSLVNWDKRQFQSDNVAARVRKHRERQEKPLSNVTETLPKRKCINVDTDTEKEVNTSYSTPEPPKHGDSGALPAVMKIPLIKRDGQFAVMQADIDGWQETFPGVDVMSKLRYIRQWNIDNPEKRKSRKGIRRHISGWLEREQNNGRRPTTRKQPDDFPL